MTSVREIQRSIYSQYRDGQKKPVDNILRLITDWTVMKEAWRIVASRSGKNTGGVDGQTVGSVRALPGGTNAFLNRIADEIQKGVWRPGRVRHFRIPKSNGSTRKLAILNVSDRVVHTAVKIVLEPIMEARLGKQCYGFRPGRGRYDELNAVRQQVQLVPELYKTALTTDIATCFDTIDHGVIRCELNTLICDKYALALLDQILAQVGNGQEGWFKRRPVGVLQGSALSPLLANLALSRFDEEWRHQQGKRHIAFRYADDLIVLAESRRDAHRVRGDVARCLRSTTRMKLEPSKTVVSTFEEGVHLLGMIVLQQHDPFRQTDVVQVAVDPERVHEILREIDQWAESVSDERSVVQCLETLNQRLRGWFATYQYASDAPQAFSAIDHHVFRTVRARLKSVLKLTVADLQALHHRLQRSGHETWAVEDTSLLILSSLPRKQYRRKERTLPWESIGKPSSKGGSLPYRLPELGDLNQTTLMPPTAPVTQRQTRLIPPRVTENEADRPGVMIAEMPSTNFADHE